MKPQKFPGRITVLVDRREQKPIEFPPVFTWWSPGNRSHLMRVQVVGGPGSKLTLPTGDYAIRGYEREVLVERKGCWSELCKNLFTNDSSRFKAALTRLKNETACPVLLLDMPLRTRASQWVREPDQVLDGIFREARRRELDVLWLPPSRTPRAHGERLLRYMWQAIYEHKFRYKPPRARTKR